MRNAFIDVAQLERAVAADFQLPALTSCTVIGHAFNDTYLLKPRRAALSAASI